MKGKLLCLPNASTEAIEKGSEISPEEMCVEVLEEMKGDKLRNILVLGFNGEGEFILKASDNTSLSHGALLLTLAQSYLASAYNGG